MSLPNNELKWILIDFDDTVACNSGHPDYRPTVPVKGAREALIGLEKEGWKITIYTARGWADYALIEEWLETFSIPHRRIICGKPLGKYIIDDRNIPFDGNWKKALKKVK